MNSKTSNNIEISVVIPAKNEEKYIERCLKSIINAKHDGGYEIILVDNGSIDNTKKIANLYQCKIIGNDRPGAASSRNIGASVAKGKFLAFIDADCVLPANWFVVLRSQLLNNKDGVLIGTKICPDPKNSTWVEDTLDRLSKRRGVDVGNKISKVKWIGTSNLLIKRDLFYKIGGFDERLLSAEDYDLCERLSSYGNIYLDQQNKTIHLRNSKTLFELFRREQVRGQNSLIHWIRSGFRFYEAPSIIMPFLFILFTVGGGGAIFFNLRGGLSLIILGIGITSIKVLRVRGTWKKPFLLFQGIVVSWIYYIARGLALLKEIFKLVKNHQL